MFTLLRILGIAVMVACFAALILIVPPLLFLLLTPLGWVLLPFVVMLAAAILTRIRRRHAASLLGYIDSAVRLNLPLPPMLRAASRGEHGIMRYHLARVAVQLEAGRPLAAALNDVWAPIPPRTVSLIDAGERLHRLPRILARLGRQHQDWAQRETARTGMVLGYPLAIVTAIAAALLFLTIVIMPLYVEIFEDYDAQLPDVTLALVATTRWISETILPSRAAPVFLWLATLLLLTLGLTLIGALAASLHSYWGYRGLTAISGVAWYLPIAGRLQRDRGLGDALHLAQQSLATGGGLPEALHEAASLRVNPVLRRRLRGWAERVEGGEEPGAAARAAGLPRLVAGLVTTSTASGSLPEALGFLHRYYDARFSRAATLAQAAITPATVLLLAAVVAWITVAMFLPLVQLMEALLPEGWVTL